MEEKRVADYFVLAGLSDTSRIPIEDLSSRDGTISPQLCSPTQGCDPITDITVIVRSQGETVPAGWSCIETTPFGFPADLNHGSLRSPSIYICFKRGTDKAPLVDVGVLYEAKERVMADSEVVHTTPFGKPANVNNSGSRTFLTYRRARDNAPCNQLVVTDICVILNNKGETPPHAFCLVPKNLNKGMVGSDVFLCYKKSMNRPQLIRYQANILGRFPLVDYDCFSLPESVPMFCMPMGATIECWPNRCQQPKPVFSTFVLTSDTAVKVYGAAVTFYEKYPESKLTEEERLQLEFVDENEKENKSLHAVKSISILSRWPFFDTFEKFLLFLYRTSWSASVTPQSMPIERYISHFMLDVPFPSVQRPKILAQLGSASDDTVLLSQPPEDMPLPLSGASFTQLLRNLGPDNCLNVLLLALAEQKMLLHSLRPDVLTGVAEAVTSLIFPFHWQCPYIPLCPLGLCDVLNAPLPFIVGVDSRYFDLYEPPLDVACVDLDTNSIYLSEHKRNLNIKLLPKRPTRLLRNTLEKLFERLVKPQSAHSNGTAYNVQTTKRVSTSPFSAEMISAKKFERQMDLEIQEAFLRFMASVLRGFRSYLKPITRAPGVGATDPGSLFDLQGFLKSRDKNHQRFYHLLMTTQMFTRFIEERSFVSDKDTSLAFFDECLDKIEATGDTDSSANMRLLDTDDSLQSDRTVFIPAPEAPSNGEGYTYPQFGPLDVALFHRHPVGRKQRLSFDSTDSGSISRSHVAFPVPGSPLSRRTKQEMRSAQRVARRHAESPLTWAKCLVSYCYSLWFIQLPSFAKIAQTSLSKGKPLRIAFEVLLRMQSLHLHPPDEVCYRVLMLLCGEYSQPVLAVKVLFEMKRNGVIPNAITYGYYNKAVLESKWPAGDTTAALLWSKLRNVVSGVHEFKKRGHLRRKRESIVVIKSSDQTKLDDKDANEPVEETKALLETNGDRNSSSGQSDVGYFSSNANHEEGSGASMFSLEQTQEVGNVCRCLKPKFDAVDFRESNKFRARTGSIVRVSASSLTCLQDYDSPAGVLMTSNYFAGEDSVFSSPDPGSERRKRHKSAEQKKVIPTSLASSKRKAKGAAAKEGGLPSVRPYFRSYSFGNDARIIKNLKEGPLRALKHELERNHQVIPAEADESATCAQSLTEDTLKPKMVSNKDSQKDQSVKTFTSLSRCEERPEEEAEEAVEEFSVKPAISPNIPIKSKNGAHSGRRISTGTTSSTDTTKSSSSDCSPLKGKGSLGSIVDEGSSGSFSPIKDAFVNMNLFSPDGKVANTLRSSFRLASRLTTGSPSKSPIARSTTFTGEPSQSPQGNHEKLSSKLSSLFRSKTLKEDVLETGSPKKSLLTRSATLPTDARIDETLEALQDCESLSCSLVTEEDEVVEKEEVEEEEAEEDDVEVGSEVALSGSPWATRLKRLEYVMTIKSAANTIGNRINEIKSTLSSSAASSPAKLTPNNGNSGVVGGTASLLSQWASLVADKLPTNFNSEGYEDECSSTNSFDMRRLSVAASEDDVSERSREGSLAKGFGFHSNINPTSSSPLFDVLEEHYTKSLDEPNTSPAVLEIEMASSCRCYTCSAVLFDEEIMEGWSADESNLNTQCAYCSSKFVPLLTVALKDKREIGSQESLLTPAHSSEQVTGSAPATNSLATSLSSRQPSIDRKSVDSGQDALILLDESPLNSKPISREATPGSSPTKSAKLLESDSRRSSRLLGTATRVEQIEPFTVPYLSPLVLRKEVENVLEHEGDICVSQPQFIDEHPIIAWNLIWYFKRINLPSHLPGLVLFADTTNKNKQIVERSRRYDYRNVLVRCLWDNDKLHEDMKKPMYRLWSESSSHSSLLHALVTDDRKVSHNVMRQILSSIQCNDMISPMKLLTNERRKSQLSNTSKHYYSVYRDLLFLSFVALGRENIDHVAFDREYRRAHEAISPKQQMVVSATDRPPSVGAIFCRRFFKELELKSLSLQTQQQSTVSSITSLA